MNGSVIDLYREDFISVLSKSLIYLFIERGRRLPVMFQTKLCVIDKMEEN